MEVHVVMEAVDLGYSIIDVYADLSKAEARREAEREKRRAYLRAQGVADRYINVDGDQYIVDSRQVL